MKQLFLQYAQYNVWANARISEFIKEEWVDIEMKSSFSTIRKTMFHIWDAQHIWLNRLNGLPVTGGPGKTFAGSFKEACSLWALSSKELVAFIESKDESFLLKEISYENLQKVAFTNKVYEIIMQICNHATFHRGQLITMLREAGATELKSTDMITFLREHHT
ncbi:MAG: DinB family protein [Bacteroidia bacterium]|nr:DinB family protein [Bacteroidia bacterium]